MHKMQPVFKQHAAKTFVPGMMSGLGGFGGLFKPDIAGMRSPVLVR